MMLVIAQHLSRACDGRDSDQWLKLRIELESSTPEPTMPGEGSGT
nr:hypothetical protein [Bradyrhizobium diazoefficiens]